MRMGDTAPFYLGMVSALSRRRRAHRHHHHALPRRPEGSGARRRRAQPHERKWVEAFRLPPLERRTSPPRSSSQRRRLTRPRHRALARRGGTKETTVTRCWSTERTSIASRLLAGLCLAAKRDASAPSASISVTAAFFPPARDLHDAVGSSRSLREVVPDHVEACEDDAGLHQLAATVSRSRGRDRNGLRHPRPRRPGCRGLARFGMRASSGRRACRRSPARACRPSRSRGCIAAP